MSFFDFIKNKAKKSKTKEIPNSTEITKWIDTVLEQGVPENVIAFCFNLYDDGDNKWSIELVGTDYFDVDDVDWACYEVEDFGTRENPLAWVADKPWNKVLEETQLILKEYLKSGKYSHILKSKNGIGVGFVDGDMIILHTK